MPKKLIPGLLVDPGPPRNQKVPCSDSSLPTGACPSSAHPASSDGTPKGSAADVDGGAIVSAFRQTKPSFPLVLSSVVMGVTAVTNVPVRDKSRHVKPVLPQIPVSPNAAKTEPVLPNVAAMKNNANDANSADVNDYLAEAMDATEDDGYTVVVKNKRKSNERFTASPAGRSGSNRRTCLSSPARRRARNLVTRDPRSSLTRRTPWSRCITHPTTTSPSTPATSRAS